MLRIILPLLLAATLTTQAQKIIHPAKFHSVKKQGWKPAAISADARFTAFIPQCSDDTEIHVMSIDVPAHATTEQCKSYFKNTPVHKLIGHKNFVSAVSFSPNGTYLASAAPHEGVVNIWDWKKERCIKSIRTVGNPLSLTFSPDSQIIAIGTGDGIVSLSNFSQSESLATHWFSVKKNGPVHALAFSPDGKTLAVGQKESTITFGEISSELGLTLSIKKCTELTFNYLPNNIIPGGVDYLEFSPCGHFLLATCSDRKLRMWDLNTNSRVHDLDYHPFSDAHFYKSSDFILIRFDYGAMVYNRHTKKNIWLQRFTAKNNQQTPLLGNITKKTTVSRDGNTIVTCSDFGEVLRWRWSFDMCETINNS